MIAQSDCKLRLKLGKAASEWRRRERGVHDRSRGLGVGEDRTCSFSTSSNVMALATLAPTGPRIAAAMDDCATFCSKSLRLKAILFSRSDPDIEMVGRGFRVAALFPSRNWVGIEGCTEKAVHCAHAAARSAERRNIVFLVRGAGCAAALAVTRRFWVSV